MQMWTAAEELLARHAAMDARDAQGRTPLDLVADACMRTDALSTTARARKSMGERLDANPDNGVHQDATASELDPAGKVAAVKASRVYANTPEARRRKLDAFLDACAA